MMQAVSDGMLTVLHNYDMRLSDGLYNRPEPATMASSYCKDVFKKNSWTVIFGTSRKILFTRNTDEPLILVDKERTERILREVQDDRKWLRQPPL
jgi:hypothetical protein